MENVTKNDRGKGMGFSLRAGGVYICRSRLTEPVSTAVNARIIDGSMSVMKAESLNPVENYPCKIQTNDEFSELFYDHFRIRIKVI